MKSITIDLSSKRSRFGKSIESSPIFGSLDGRLIEPRDLTIYGTGNHERLAIGAQQITLRIISPNGRERIIATAFVNRKSRHPRYGPATMLTLDGQKERLLVLSRGKWIEIHKQKRLTQTAPIVIVSK